MSELPAYSVLMSVYSKETPGFLRQALESMLNQTVKPAEIVIIEDGPLTEELYAVLDSYSDNCGDLFVRIKNEKNIGLGLSLNKGVQACTNELIARMDTDDISRTDRCEKQLKAFANNPEIDVVGGQINEFIDDVNHILSERRVPCSHDEICKFLKARDPFNHPTVMFKKSAVINAGNYMDLHYNEDYYLWIRMYLNGAQFANLDDTLLDMRISEDLYARRGGIKYFNSQKQVFKFMRKNKMISWFEYQKAKAVRFVVQVLMPNRMRAWAYKKFVRQ